MSMKPEELAAEFERRAKTPTNQATSEEFLLAASALRLAAQPQSPADALRAACGATNGCSCADLNYQWYGPSCEATMTSVLRTMLSHSRPDRGDSVAK